MKRLFLIGSFLFVVCLPIIYPFLLPGYFPSHDGEWAVVRLAEMHREIKELQLPPRWAGYLNHGYGYPLFLFTYPLPYYLTEIFHLVGFGFVNAIKFGFVLTVIGSAATMFLLARRMWGTWGGLISTVLYLYAPYRLSNLFVRGSLGESLAFVIFPLLFLSFQKLVADGSTKLIVICSLGLGALILTHNALAILFLPTFILWLIYLLSEKKFAPEKVKAVLVALTLGLVVSAFFWLPALVEKSNIVLSQIPLADKSEHFLSVRELVSTTWSFRIRPPLFLGASLVLATLMSLGIFLSRKQSGLKQRLLVLLGLAIFSLFMLFPASQFLWQMPLVKDIDFPWRMLSVVTFLLALISGVLAQYKWGKLVAMFIIILVVGLNLGYIKTQNRIFNEDSYYETNDATTTSAGELMPIWVKDAPRNRPSEKAILESSQGKVTVEKDTSTNLKLQVEVPIQTNLIVNTVFFPGWKAFVDQVTAEILVAPQTGLMTLLLPDGKHEVELIFKNTGIRQFADILSVGGIILLSYLWHWRKKSFR